MENVAVVKLDERKIEMKKNQNIQNCKCSTIEIDKAKAKAKLNFVRKE